MATIVKTRVLSITRHPVAGYRWNFGWGSSFPRI